MKKQAKLTPEQKAEENARIAKASTERQAAKLAADQARYAEQRQLREDFLAKARGLSEMKSSGGRDVEAQCRVIEDIARQFLDADHRLSEYARDFMFAPARNFEWAREEFEIAAKHEMLAKIICRINEGTHSLKEVLESASECITDSLLRDEWRGNSTSSTSNAMSDARRAAGSNMISGYGSLKHWLRTLSEAQAEAVPSINLNTVNA